MGVPGKLDDLLAVRAARIRVPWRLIETWPSPLDKVYSLPRCARPGFRSLVSAGGRTRSYTVLSLPGAPCGWRSNGPASDGGKPYGIVVGDSFTEAAEVSDEEHWVARLSELAGRRFLNVGLGAQGLVGHIERLRASGAMALRPKLLIVQVCFNDLFEDEWARLANEARAGRAQWDLSKTRPPPRWLGRFAGHLWYTAVMRWRGQPKPTELQWRLLESNLELLRREARRVDARLLIMAEPTVFARALNRRMPEARAVEISLAPDRRLFYDRHWNARGHLDVARRIKGDLVSRGLLERSVAPQSP